MQLTLYKFLTKEAFKHAIFYCKIPLHIDRYHGACRWR